MEKAFGRAARASAECADVVGGVPCFLTSSGIAGRSAAAFSQAGSADSQRTASVVRSRVRAKPLMAMHSRPRLLPKSYRRIWFVTSKYLILLASPTGFEPVLPP